jgi:hypothetical protein
MIFQGIQCRILSGLRRVFRQRLLDLLAHLEFLFCVI